MTKLLINIMTCQAHVEHREAIRKTWFISAYPQTSIHFFEGGHKKQGIKGDTIQLTCGDGYSDQAKKTYELLEFCNRKFEFDYIFLDGFYVLHILLTYLPYTSEGPENMRKRLPS